MSNATATAMPLTNEDRFNGVTHAIETAVETAERWGVIPGCHRDAIQSGRNYVKMMDRDGVRACFTDMEWLALTDMRDALADLDEVMAQA